MPQRVVTAGNGACTTTLLSGKVRADSDEVFIFHEVVAGGGGACWRYDGLSGIQVNMTNTSNMPIEATEIEFPQLLARKNELKEDSGGAGQFRGGLGIERELEMREDHILYTGLGDRHKIGPWGLEGGKPGKVGAFYRVYKDGHVQHLSNKVTSLSLMNGERIRVITPGAGGYGNPKCRDPQKVLQDVIEDKVSIAAAEEEYGVSISGNAYDGYQIDEIKTAILRNKEGMKQ